MKTLLRSLCFLTALAFASTAVAQRTVFQVDVSSSGQFADFLSSPYTGGTLFTAERIDSAQLGDTPGFRELSDITIFSNLVGGGGETARVTLYGAPTDVGGGNFTFGDVIWASPAQAVPSGSFDNPLTFAPGPSETIILPEIVYYGVTFDNLSAAFFAGPSIEDPGGVPTSDNPPAPGIPAGNGIWIAQGGGNYIQGTSQTQPLAITINAIPEPGVASLMGIGLILAAAIRRSVKND